jgi:galactose-1-phosphate uridylyltransferase
MKAFPSMESMLDKEMGMDLRDYFAAKAMTMISYPSTLNEYNTEHFKKYMQLACECCYQIADKMMEVRNG